MCRESGSSPAASVWTDIHMECLGTLQAVRVSAFSGTLACGAKPHRTPWGLESSVACAFHWAKSTTAATPEAGAATAHHPIHARQIVGCNQKTVTLGPFNLAASCPEKATFISYRPTFRNCRVLFTLNNSAVASQQTTTTWDHLKHRIDPCLASSYFIIKEPRSLAAAISVSQTLWNFVSRQPPAAEPGDSISMI